MIKIKTMYFVDVSEFVYTHYYILHEPSFDYLRPNVTISVQGEVQGATGLKLKNKN